MGDVFLLEERQASVLNSSVILVTAVTAFIGQLLSVFLGMEKVTKSYK